MTALIAGLDSFGGPSTGDGLGGFGTDDMNEWRWGMRHMARFESVLAEFLGSDGAFGALTAGFAITPGRLQNTKNSACETLSLWSESVSYLCAQISK